MIVQIRDSKKTLISIQNYNKYQTLSVQKWDENGTSLGTGNGTCETETKSVDTTELQNTTEINRDMSQDR